MCEGRKSRSYHLVNLSSVSGIELGSAAGSVLGMGSGLPCMILVISRYPTRAGSNILPLFKLIQGRPGIGEDSGREMSGVTEEDEWMDGVVEGVEMKGEDGEVERKRIENWQDTIRQLCCRNQSGAERTPPPPLHRLFFSCPKSPPLFSPFPYPDLPSRVSLAAAGNSKTRRIE